LFLSIFWQVILSKRIEEMTNLEKLSQRYDIGNKIFQKFAGKNTAQTKDILIKILPETYKGIDIHSLISSGSCYKKFRDDGLTDLDICFYDKIHIQFDGISFVPEHRSAEMLIQFDNNFNASQLD